MKVVCDTNVLVSGILFGCHSRRILVLASRGTITNFISPEILREVEDVLSRPKFKLKPQQVQATIGLFRDSFELITPSKSLKVVHADPDDDRILEAALAAEAESVISGDQHLLSMKTWKGISIMSPADFMSQHRS